MNTNQTQTNAQINIQKNDEIEIDLLHLARVLWQKAWIIILTVAVFGAATFVGVTMMVEPTYQSSAMMYVNSTDISLGGTKLSVSSGELSAAKSLVDVYRIILRSRTTLERVIEEAALPYSVGSLRGMISCGSVENTEIFRITATSTSAEEAQLIVATITRLLPERISEIVEGTSVRIVDYAVVESGKVGPARTRMAVIGMLIGAVLSAGLIILAELLDNTVKDGDYLMEKYQLPVLAVIPDMRIKRNDNYYYYSNYGTKK